MAGIEKRQAGKNSRPEGTADQEKQRGEAEGHGK